MRVVLDTNVLLSSISPTSTCHWIYQGIFDGTFIVCLTTDVLEEYAEVIERFYGFNVADAVLTALIYSPFVEEFSPSYFWNMIEQDPDDNKFVDCAITAGADFIITNDRHFKILEQIPFPKILTLKPEQLKILLG